LAVQFIRVCRLTSGGNTWNLDDAAVEFLVRQKTVQMPNIAEIRVYNLTEDSRTKLCKQNQEIILEAGYRGRYSAIFKGTIKQGNRGKVKGTDTFVDLFCGDGDQAYIRAQVSKTLPAGSTRQQVVDECLKAFGPYGVSKGFMSSKLAGFTFPRPVTLFGLAREQMRTIARDIGADWSFQSGQLDVLHKTEAKPGGEYVLNSRTGLIGRATQTFNGIIVRTLLNNIQCGGVIRLDEKSIDLAAPDSTFGYETPNNAKLPSIATDGRYKVYGIDRVGVMRGQDWYNILYCAAANTDQSYLPRALLNYQQ